MDEKLQKRAYFAQEARLVIEEKQIAAEFSTTLISDAKNVYSPYTTVGVAKNNTSLCKTPIATNTLSKDEVAIDRKVSNAITDCKEELSYANFNLSEMYRQDVYATVLSKLNTNAIVDFVAGATIVVGTKDLSDAAKVRSFLISVRTNAGKITGLKGKVDNATIKRAKRHNKPFVAAGTDAFVAISEGIASSVALSSTKGIDGDIIETPYGVTVINLGDAAADAKQLIYGTIGATTMCFNKNEIKADMGEFMGTTTATATDLEVGIGDELLERTWYVSVSTVTKNKVFANVKTLVSSQLML